MKPGKKQDRSRGELVPPSRLLLGPGPSLVHPRVLEALSRPLLGHLDCVFLGLMDEIQQLLRKTFRTKNQFAIPISGTGSAGMEALVVNLVEPGESVLVGINGVFGGRLASMVQRCGGKVLGLEAPWGQIIDPNDIRKTLDRSGPVKVVALVHAETSTGVWQPLSDIGAICREHDALLLVDAVTSLGGIPVEVDEWMIDACFSGTQKCLSCPPGLAPVTLNERAWQAVRRRMTPCQSWYLDLALVADYWTEEKRVYHHTAPISMLYALHEALRLVHEEGLQARFERHAANSAALQAGLSALGLDPLPPMGYRLPTLHCVSVPQPVQEGMVRSRLLQEYGIEIGGGLGPLQGKVWRIGLMGESSRQDHVLTVLNALEEIFCRAQWLDVPGVAVQAAAQAYDTFAKQKGKVR